MPNPSDPSPVRLAASGRFLSFGELGGGQEIFDFVVNTAADLPAPVAGVRTLTAGSWAFTDRVTLPAGETIFCANGVQLYGIGETGVSGLRGEVASPFFLLMNAGLLWGMTIENLDDTVGNRCVAVSKAELLIDNCEIGAAFGGSGGLWLIDPDAHVLAVSSVFRNPSVAAPQPAVEINDSGSGVAEFRSTDCRFVSEPGGACIEFISGARCDLVQPRFQASALGVRVTAGLAAELRVTGGVSELGSPGFSLLSQIGRAVLVNHEFASPGVVTMAAVDAPVNGLAIVACGFGVAAPFVGFAPTDARVNVKACLTTAPLFTETAIVP